MVPLFFPENGPINSARPLLLEKEVYTGRHKAFSSFPHLRSLGAVPSYIFFLSFLPLPFPPLAGLFSFNVYNDLANLPRDLSTLPPSNILEISIQRDILLCSPCSCCTFSFFFGEIGEMEMENRMGIERERESMYFLVHGQTHIHTHPGNPVFPFAL